MPLEVDRWIGDYRSIGRVDRPDDLRGAIDSINRAATQKVLMWMLAPFVLLGITMGVGGWAFFGEPGPWGDLVALIAAIVGVACCALMMLRGRDVWKTRAQAKSALACTRPERFELGEHARQESVAAEALGLDAPRRAFPESLLVDPETSLLLQVDATPVASLEPVEIHAFARVQAHGERAARRHLEPSELDELRRAIRRESRRAMGLCLVYAWLTFGFAGWGYRLLTGYPMEPFDWTYVATVGVLWPLATFWLRVPFRRWRRVLPRLRRDLRAGVAETIEGHVAAADLRASRPLDESSLRINPSVVWRLPQSGLWWDVDGIPAGWRRGSEGI